MIQKICVLILFFGDFVGRRFLSWICSYSFLFLWLLCMGVRSIYDTDKLGFFMVIALLLLVI